MSSSDPVMWLSIINLLVKQNKHRERFTCSLGECFYLAVHSYLQDDFAGIQTVVKAEVAQSSPELVCWGVKAHW